LISLAPDCAGDNRLRSTRPAKNLLQKMQQKAAD
jgi:hypothetical protein